MENDVRIYGKDTCPHTIKVREVYSRRNIDFTYLDVIQDPDALREMLSITGGVRRVPVIVQDEEFTIGFGGT